MITNSTVIAAQTGYSIQWSIVALIAIAVVIIVLLLKKKEKITESRMIIVTEVAITALGGITCLVYAIFWGDAFLVTQTELSYVLFVAGFILLANAYGRLGKLFKKSKVKK